MGNISVKKKAVKKASKNKILTILFSINPKPFRYNDYQKSELIRPTRAREG